jgi:ribose 5-phosphate isomerase B
VTSDRPVLAAIGADHHGHALTVHVTRWLRDHGVQVEDRTPEVPDEEVDYPLICVDVAEQVTAGAADWGLVIGGSGQGEVIAANKVRGIRAAVCHTGFGTTVARAHNDANLMVLGAKIVSAPMALEMLATWIRTPFKGGQHARRLEQITALEGIVSARPGTPGSGPVRSSRSAP